MRDIISSMFGSGIKDIIMVVFAMLIVLTGYRIKGLLRDMRMMKWEMAVQTHCLEMVKDLWAFIQSLFILLTLYRFIDYVVDITEIVLDRHNAKEARRYTTYTCRAILKDIKYLFRFTLFFNTYKWTLAIVFFGLLVPAASFSSMLGICTKKCAGLRFGFGLLFYFVLIGYPFYLLFEVVPEALVEGTVATLTVNGAEHIHHLIFGFVVLLCVLFLLSQVSIHQGEDFYKLQDFQITARFNKENMLRVLSIFWDTCILCSFIIFFFVLHPDYSENENDGIFITFKNISINLTFWTENTYNLFIWVSISVVFFTFLVSSAPIVIDQFLGDNDGRDDDVGKFETTKWWVGLMRFLVETLNLAIVLNLFKAITCEYDYDNPSEAHAFNHNSEICWTGTHKVMALLAMLCLVFFILTPHTILYDRLQMVAAQDANQLHYLQSLDITYPHFYDVVTKVGMVLMISSGLQILDKIKLAIGITLIFSLVLLVFTIFYRPIISCLGEKNASACSVAWVWVLRVWQYCMVTWTSLMCFSKVVVDDINWVGSALCAGYSFFTLVFLLLMYIAKQRTRKQIIEGTNERIMLRIRESLLSMESDQDTFRRSIFWTESIAKRWIVKVQESINPRVLALLFLEFEKYLALELYTASFFKNYHDWHDDLTKRQLTDNELWKIIEDVRYNVEARVGLHFNLQQNDTIATGGVLDSENLSKFLNQDSADCWGSDIKKTCCFKPSSKWTRISCAVDIEFLIEFADDLMKQILINKNAVAPIAIAAADTDSEKELILEMKHELGPSEQLDQLQPGVHFENLDRLWPGDEQGGENAPQGEGRDTANAPNIRILDTANAPPADPADTASAPPTDFWSQFNDRLKGVNDVPPEEGQEYGSQEIKLEEKNITGNSYNSL
jgi:hypothetical protein